MKKILVVVDMQNDFISGSLGTKDAANIVENVVRKIEQRKAEGYEIILTKDTHEPDYLETKEGKHLPVVHGIKGTYGWQIEPRVAHVAGDCTVIEKNTFGSPALFALLQKANPDVVEFVGVCTDICVVSNALGAKAFLPDADIYVDSSCCAGATVKGHKAALETMRACQVLIV
jgi:nicotinamidase-related amidase